MPDQGTVYDGHVSLDGMDAYSEPAELNLSTVTKAVNRQFRGGINRTRPAFRQAELIFENDEDKTDFTNGNVQGICAYKKVRPGRRDGLVVAVAGSMYFLTLVNEKAYVYRFFRGNNPKLMQTWLIQVEEWVYAQDGESLPMFWDGLIPSTARRSNGVDEMPIGNAMAYGHGRVFVTNQYNQIAASDVMYGKGFTDTTNVQKFTEGTIQANGGFFTLPNWLGMIGGIIFLPVMGLNNRGQGPVLVLGTHGAISIDVGRPRNQWEDSPPDRIELVGRGCIASESVVIVNGDPWFKSDDGISAYLATASDEQRKTTLRNQSKHVSNWLNTETRHLRKYATSVYFDNRMLSTSMPFTELPNNDKYGVHRFFRGFLVADFDTVGGDGTSGMNWDGLWTGIRPTAAVVGDISDVARCFAMSYDRDGKNRLYQITKLTANDNGKKQIESFYVTRKMSYRESGAGEFKLKQLIGGVTWISEISDEIQMSVDYRADHYQLWNNLMPLRNFGNKEPESSSGLPISRQREKKYRFPSPDANCRDGTDDVTNAGYQFQGLVKLFGNVRVDRIRFMSRIPNTETVSVDGDDCGDIKPEKAIEGTIESDYTYFIV